MTPTKQVSDLKILDILRNEIAYARNHGQSSFVVPLWIAERVLEKAERPHD